MDYKKWIKIWLFIGLGMVFIQVVVGGITRLTGSGLSITKWEIVVGTFPPTNAQQWEEAFDLYKASPQYEKINKGMSMGEFKFIYFWEYIHRLWARLMGFVFLIPFLFFMLKKQISKQLLYRLGVVIFFAVLAAIFGWIMVASGLVNRPWVNAYKLTIHLGIAFCVYAALLWAILEFIDLPKVKLPDPSLKKGIKWILLLLIIQIGLGGIMSGMKAGIFYPTWPDMNGQYFPQILFNANEWNVDNLVNYDTNAFMPALIQFSHRTIAYILFFFGIYFTYKAIRSENSGKNLNKWVYLFIILLISQVVLGIFTVINCSGTIPVTLGVLHQAFALLLLTSVIVLIYILKKESVH